MLKRLITIAGLLAILLTSCGPTAKQVEQTRSAVATLTATHLPTATYTPWPSDTPTDTLTPSLTPTITRTPFPSFTPTFTPTATLTQTLTLTPSNTPTKTTTPTPTPVLPRLRGLVITSTHVADVFLWDWRFPPQETSFNLGEIACKVDCIGYRWDNQLYNGTLSLTLYRTPKFEDALATVAGSKTFYIDSREFELVDIPPGGNLPSFSWAAQKENKDFVMMTAQGPAVVILFVTRETPLDPTSTLEDMAQLLGKQSSILRGNGYLTLISSATEVP